MPSKRRPHLLYVSPLLCLGLHPLKEVFSLSRVSALITLLKSVYCCDGDDDDDDDDDDDG